MLASAARRSSQISSSL
uniref:Uncharacterized protein n=1 Tax=Arundo donax TaxID=35708 RepID=A0A0A9EX72_ARUDO